MHIKHPNWGRRHFKKFELVRVFFNINEEVIEARFNVHWMGFWSEGATSFQLFIDQNGEITKISQIKCTVCTGCGVFDRLFNRVSNAWDYYKQNEELQKTAGKFFYDLQGNK